MENGYHSHNSVDSKLVDDATKKRRDVISRELLKMRERDENAILRQRANKKELKKLALETSCCEKMDKYRPITLLPDAVGGKRYGGKAISDETRFAATGFSPLKTPRRGRKHDSKVLQKVENPVTLVTNFWKCRPTQNANLPENIRRELTSAEISDLRLVFNIFDVKNRGYITVHDLEMAVGLLGFPARTGDVKDMVSDESCKDKRGRVTFKHFLQLIVKLQNDGADCVEEIVQFFRRLDQGGKGYITFADVKNTADELKAGLSNREIGEMMQEADSNGDGRVSLQELTCIVKQTGAFIYSASVI